MKKLTLLTAAAAFAFSSQAQLFSDDFESYSTGSYLGPQSTEWTTWSGNEGGAEDVQISSARALSGANSIYFAGGGSQDILLDLGQQYTSGVFTFTTNLFVASGSKAYFNLQGGAMAGQTWAMDCFIDDNGLNIQEAGAVSLSASAPMDTWFEMTIVANLSTGIWETIIDGQSVGKWINAVNAVSSINYYPIDGSYKFYVDDVSFDHQAYTPSNLNAAVAELNMNGVISGQTTTPSLTIKNVGNTAITSYDISFEYNGNTVTETVASTNLAVGNTETVTFPSVALLAGLSVGQAYINNVNGASDDLASDDSVNVVVNPIVPAAGKVVVGEEGTGTWCQWCPRGDVFMAQFAADFDGYWKGIAVHNNDPMVYAAYDQGLNLSGYPGAKVDRGTAVDPSQMYGDFVTRLQIAPKATFDLGANWDANTRTLAVSASTNFQETVSSGYRIAFILTEDNVTGTTAQYAQSNAYAGGGNGPMGGYENLPNPVPASQMVYNHVGRHIGPTFQGYNGAFQGGVTSGETKVVNYAFEIDASWNTDNMYVVTLLLAPNGRVDNAGYAKFSDIIANDYVEGEYAGMAEAPEVKAELNLYPNPATTAVNLAISMPTAADVNMTITDMSGKVLAERTYENLQGDVVLPYNTSSLAKGVYLVNMTTNGNTVVKRMIIE